MHTFSKNAKKVLPKINFQVWLIIRKRLQRTILNKNIKRLNRIELKIGKPLLNFRRNSNFYFASLSQQQRRQSINFRTKSASPVRWSAIFMEHVVITKPTFSADENRNEGTIMTGCKAKFIARLLCPRSLNRRNPNVKGLRYSFDAANLFSLSLSLLSILYDLLPRMRTEYVFLPKSARENEFRGNRKCTGPLVLSRYFDYSWLLKAPGEGSSNPGH